MKAKDVKKVVVVGGAGAMGRISVRDLFETAPDMKVVVADANEQAARKLARSMGSPRVVGVGLDVSDARAAAKVLAGSFAVINACQYQLNLPVMKACLAAGAHYCDLGGLFHVTREQLEWHDKFAAKGLLALLGIGAAPGTTNLLAKDAIDKMDKVTEIHIQVGGVDLAPKTGAGAALAASYSIQTILEETSRPAAVFTNGRFKFVEPHSGPVDVHFPEPVGLRRPKLTIHSEVATLPLTYKSKGLRECTFAIAFDEDLTEKLRFLRAIGINSQDPLAFEGKEIVPHEFLLACLRAQPRPKPPAEPTVPNEYEVIRALVRGETDGRAVEDTVDCHVTGMPTWGFGIDVDTGCPPSIAVQMIARGEITARGALPPEQCIPLEPYYAELAKRNMRVRRPGPDAPRPDRKVPVAISSQAN